MQIRALMLVLSTAIAATAPQQASAAAGIGLIPAALTAAAAYPAKLRCTAALASLQPATMSKSSALLGGAPSKLDQIMRDQAGSAALTLAGSQTTILAAPQPLCPSGQTLAAVQPSRFLPDLRMGGQVASMPGEFLSSRRIAISHTRFDADWARISHSTLSAHTLGNLGLAAKGEGEHEKMQAINAWTNLHIRYAEDEALYHKADYWADSRSTLKRGAGDCEDIAILKMQLLAAAGVPRDAMYLTIARDLVRHADHALLVVREGEKFWLLDNSTDNLLDANASLDYRPIMSFSQQGKWLHGF